MASRATAYRTMGGDDRRDAARADAHVLRVMVEGQATDAALAEISIYGCRITCDIDAQPDEPVRLSLSGSLPIPARVVWNRDGMIGCRFDQPIGRPLLRSLTIG